MRGGTFLSSSTSLMFSFLLIIHQVRAMDMDMDTDPIDLSNTGAPGKSFHWILTLFLILILPSISTMFSFSNKFPIAFILQCVSAIYAFFDAAFLRFPDLNDHEIGVSRAFSWVVFIFSCVTVFSGSLANTKKVALPIFVKFYKGISFATTLMGWIRTILAPMAMFGFAQEGNKRGQMVAHLIMGSAFVIYGFYLLLTLVIPWIRINKTGRFSPEFYDSCVMCAWGIVNTFTEHRWGKEPWSHGDYQHTSMGIIWWAGGLLGMWLTRNGQRSFIPALLLMFTGFSMGQHVQVLEISTKVHAFFGYTLAVGGLARIIEISFVLKDERYHKPDGEILSFQYFPSFCLIEAGILFMGANEEQLMLVRNLGADHSAYILVLSSAAFVIQLWFILLLEGYLHFLGNVTEEGGFSLGNEYSRVDEFELNDLSDDDARSLAV